MDERGPAVTCTACARAWNSASMAEGLRLLGACPRCRGELSFRDTEPGVAPPLAAAPAGGATVAPHLVLGIPRRNF